MNAGWDESEHPRDRLGRFTERWADQVSTQMSGIMGHYAPVRAPNRLVDGTNLHLIGARFSDEEAQPPWWVRGGDVLLGAVYDLQNYHQKPQVVSRAELDKAISEGATELWRGVKPNGSKTAWAIAEEFRTGDRHYPGEGIWGNGTYTTPRRETAIGYLSPRGSDNPDDPYFESHRGLIRMALRPDARVADFDILEDEFADYMNYGPRDADGASPRVTMDLGRYAALRGYDAIKRKTMTVILNRSAVLVEEETP